MGHSGLIFYDSKILPRDKENSFKLLRIEMENYSLHDDDGNVLNRTSMDIALFSINLLNEI